MTEEQFDTLLYKMMDDGLVEMTVIDGEMFFRPTKLGTESLNWVQLIERLALEFEPDDNAALDEWSKQFVQNYLDEFKRNSEAGDM